METYRNFLVQELSVRKAKNPQFSLRSFARVLNMSPAQLSLLINGKRNLTSKQASKIIDKLNLTKNEAVNLLSDTAPLLEKLKTNMTDLHSLSDEEFNLISDWTHFAILSLSRLKNNKSNAKWIAKKLGIDPIKAMEAFLRLQRLGLIEITSNSFKQSKRPLTTTTDVPSAAIRRYHKQNLDLAREKIETVPIGRREFSAITMAVNPTKINKVKKMINEFKQLVCQELEDDQVSEVYTLSIQLFPLTEGEK